ncbi:MAG: hypothetical protein ACYS5F_04460 [Planctomycetota bacterium]
MNHKKWKVHFGQIQAQRSLVLVLSCYIFVTSLCLGSETVAEKNDSVFSLFNFKKNKEAESIQEVNSLSSTYDTVDQICGLIYQGDFESAGSLIEEAKEKNTDQAEAAQIVQLEQIVHEYQEMQNKHQSNRKISYQEQLKKLNKLENKKDTPDANDVNDSNDLISVLSIIAQAAEFANEEQKTQLLSMPFVTETLEKAKSKATEYEKEGKWLDAYSECYAWLRAIYENNQEYSDYGDKLLDKANVEASFRDSPCETTQDRYRGVRRSMFERAVEALNFNYVSISIDYRQMMRRGIERCKQKMPTVQLKTAASQRTTKNLLPGQ